MSGTTKSMSDNEIDELLDNTRQDWQQLKKHLEPEGVKQ